MLDLHAIDRNWTLFLDRDGVINHEKEGSYIFHYGEFTFYEGVREAMGIFRSRFAHIFVVTNQRGVGKGLMTVTDLQDIHGKMTLAISEAGGHIDAIYYCDSLDNTHPDRKPNPGMAFAARAAFPAVNLQRSIMVGNNISDMEFGKNAGMYTVFLRTTKPGQETPHPLIDLDFNSLYEFAKALQ